MFIHIKDDLYINLKAIAAFTKTPVYNNIKDKYTQNILITLNGIAEPVEISFPEAINPTEAADKLYKYLIQELKLYKLMPL